MYSAEELIRLLSLAPLPLEGGYYRETYRSASSLPDGRALSTAIYYLLTPGACSTLHRLLSDEIFHFYYGDPVQMLLLRDDGWSDVVVLNNDAGGGLLPQVVVPAGVWQGSLLVQGGQVALLGTTVSPGFEFSELEQPDRELLCRLHPQRAELIRKLTPC